MKIVFLGPPGAGKGTYADILSQHYRIPHISTGDMFRAIKTENSELGKKVANLINNGKFVDDVTTLEVIANRLSNSDAVNGYILDGFPRTLHQAENFQEIDLVLCYTAPDALLKKRLVNRITCEEKNCQAVYNLKTNPPKETGICNKCGHNLITRKDQDPAIVDNRLRIYQEKTAPLIAFYKNKGILKEINADRSIEDVIKTSKEILDALVENNSKL